MIPPAENLRHGIRARDEEELRVRALPLEVPQRVDRVGRPLAIDVDAAHRERRIGCGGDHRHEIAMLAGGDVALLPGAARGDEDDLVEPEGVRDLAGSDEMAVVDRVERSPHHTDARCARRRHSRDLVAVPRSVTVLAVLGGPCLGLGRVTVGDIAV
ncbi:hypothetical protein ABE10_00050 [Bacillus toyonensis]|nr:hypothetical protein [Bacillus toyonensis]